MVLLYLSGLTWILEGTWRRGGLTHFEVPEERIDEEVEDDEWRKDKIETTHKDESMFQTFNQILPPPFFDKLFPDLTPPVKEVAHETVP